VTGEPRMGKDDAYVIVDGMAMVRSWLTGHMGPLEDFAVKSMRRLYHGRVVPWAKTPKTYGRLYRGLVYENVASHAEIVDRLLNGDLDTASFVGARAGGESWTRLRDVADIFASSGMLNSGTAMWSLDRIGMTYFRNDVRKSDDRNVIIDMHEYERWRRSEEGSNAIHTANDVSDFRPIYTDWYESDIVNISDEYEVIAKPVKCCRSDRVTDIFLPSGQRSLGGAEFLDEIIAPFRARNWRVSTDGYATTGNDPIRMRLSGRKVTVS